MTTEARAKKLNDRVMRYLDLLQTDKPDQIEHALDKLEMVDMTLVCLTDTKCGRIVNRMIKDPEFGDRAYDLVLKWRKIADAETVANKQKVVAQEMREQSESMNMMMVKQELSDEDVKPPKVKMGKRSSPLNDFEAQLLQADKQIKPKKKIKHEFKEEFVDEDDIQRELLQGLGSQIPSSSVNEPKKGVVAVNGTTSDELDLTIFKRKDRAKVYAGRRKAPTGLVEVPTLLQTCQRFLQNHIDQVEELGDAPYNILECVFERCTPAQLDRISEKNPQLHEDLSSLWERHTKASFKNAERKSKERNWYQTYKRLCRERDEKLKSITSRINQRSQHENAPVSSTLMISEVINPMNMQKRQIRNGLIPTVATNVGAHEVSQARREIFNKGSKSALLRLPNTSATKGSVLGRNSNSSSKAIAPKRGVLMAKATKMFKSMRR